MRRKAFSILTRTQGPGKQELLACFFVGKLKSENAAAKRPILHPSIPSLFKHWELLPGGCESEKLGSTSWKG